MKSVKLRNRYFVPFFMMGLVFFVVPSFGEVSQISLPTSKSKPAETIFAIEGPPLVQVGQEFEYIIKIQNPPCATKSCVLLYYYPPKCLEFVSIESLNPEKFLVGYSEDFNRIYGETSNIKEEMEVSIKVKLRVLPNREFHHERAAASYFSFIVCPKKGEAREYYKRQGLKIVEKA